VGSVLSGRAVIAVGGEARVAFLEGLLSCSVEGLAPGEVRYGALLTPQGKIVSDMFLHGFADRIALDVPSQAAQDLARRLAMYKLRAAVTVALTDEVVVVGDGPADPRAPGLGGRTIAPAGTEDGDAAAYHAARVARGVPDAVVDFPLGDAFPHDANMDLTGGVDFRKGCFVGQEVVSRMRHRGTARRRTIIVEADGPLPETGAAVTAGGREAGRLGTVVGNAGLATVRIDRVGDVAEAGGIAVRLRVPEGAPFALGKADADG